MSVHPPCGTDSVYDVPEAVAVIVRGVGWVRGYLVRVEPGGREFWARSWGDMHASLPEMGVKPSNVRFASDAVREAILQKWGPNPG